MTTIEELFARGVLSALDYHFARTIVSLVPEACDEVALGAAFASRAVQAGHVCVNLRHLSADDLVDDEERAIDAVLPALDDWRRALAESPVVASDTEGNAPLILDREDRLYLHRYAFYQRDLAMALRERADRRVELDAKLLSDGVRRLFQKADGDDADLQRVAAIIASHRMLCIVSGGPGTGKTHTVAKILALLHEQAAASGRQTFRVLLMAPTGKAAQRLGDSLTSNLHTLDCAPETVDAISASPTTIHRALGFQPRTPTRFRHGPDRPLAADVVLVDEASMVDLALMAKLVLAVPRNARLILLGDKDQLASVEAGAILGDVYNADADHAYSDELSSQLEGLGAGPTPTRKGRARGVQDCMVHLTKSYRYRDDSGIGRLARAINRGDAESALALLDAEPAEDVRLITPAPDVAFGPTLREAVLDGYGVLASVEPPSVKLASLDRFRILCAHRRGPTGVGALNDIAAQILREAGLAPDDEHYEGRPVLVTRNDYQLELFNGDVGVIARDEHDRLRAFFQGPTGLRSFLPARLPPHETVFATTVHKSQGSEFDRVALVLPEETSPVLTRELVYTGVTRGKRFADVYSSGEVLTAAILRRIERASGLRDALWG